MLVDKVLANKVREEALAAHECGHAVCALAHGVQVLKIQNGVRLQFTAYDARTFPNAQVRKIVSMAGPVAESHFLKSIGYTGEICSAGDISSLLEYREPDGSWAAQLKTKAKYENAPQVARLQASVDHYLMDGTGLPSEFRHIIEQARTTLMEHRDTHDDFIDALFEKGGVLRESDIRRIWKTNKVQHLGRPADAPVQALQAQ